MVRFVTFNNEPVIIHEKEIEDIRIIEACAMDVVSESIFITGDKVRIINGVFNRMEGILIRKSSKDRLVLKLMPLKLAVSIEMPDVYVLRIS